MIDYDGELLPDYCWCGREATYGCHGVRQGMVYSEHFCDDHYGEPIPVPPPFKLVSEPVPVAATEVMNPQGTSLGLLLRA